MRILVVANETAASLPLKRLIHEHAGDTKAEVLVVAPALIGRLDFWATDDRRARREAEQRLDHCLQSLRGCGIDASGHVGDSDPLLAISDVLNRFDADEIVISTHSEGTSNWLARNVVSRARARFRQAVHHLEASEQAREPAAAGRRLVCS